MKRLLGALLLALVLLLLLIAALLAAARLLHAVGDDPAARAIDYIALGAGILFFVDLVAIVIAISLVTLASDTSGESRRDPP